MPFKLITEKDFGVGLKHCHFPVKNTASEFRRDNFIKMQ
jgi:hypothetical protein